MESVGSVENSMKEKILKSFGVVVLIFALLFVSVLVILKLMGGREKGEAKIIVTNFVAYDFARAVTDDKNEVAMLVKPGTETHTFEPTPEDIIKIKNADLFIYNGGESDEWVKGLLSDNDIPAEKTMRMMDFVGLLEEEVVEGMEAEEEEDVARPEGYEEYDEHIWTSPVNAAKIVDGVRAKLSEIRPGKKLVYKENAEKYIAQINEIHAEISEVVKNANRKELIFADRFPFRYLVNEYGLSYFAAFPGCSDQTEASSATVAFLINKVKADDIKIVLKIELSSEQLAKMVASETGAEVMVLNAAHNVSQSDFDKGVTYVDIMRENVKVLERALE